MAKYNLFLSLLTIVLSLYSSVPPLSPTFPGKYSPRPAKKVTAAITACDSTSSKGLEAAFNGLTIKELKSIHEQETMSKEGIKK